MIKDHQISRNCSINLAARDDQRSQENKLLLEQLNEAYDDKTDAVEIAMSEAMRRKHRKLMEGER